MTLSLSRFHCTHFSPNLMKTFSSFWASFERLCHTPYGQLLALKEKVGKLWLVIVDTIIVSPDDEWIRARVAATNIDWLFHGGLYWQGPSPPLFRPFSTVDIRKMKIACDWIRTANAIPNVPETTVPHGALLWHEHFEIQWFFGQWKRKKHFPKLRINWPKNPGRKIPVPIGTPLKPLKVVWNNENGEKEAKRSPKNYHGFDTEVRGPWALCPFPNPANILFWIWAYPGLFCAFSLIQVSNNKYSINFNYLNSK